MYRPLGQEPIDAVYEVLPWNIQPILQPKVPSMTDSASGTLLATLLAIIPASIAGAVAAATAAGYSDKQREWALYGAAGGGAVAALLLGLNAVRKSLPGQ